MTEMQLIIKVDFNTGIEMEENLNRAIISSIRQAIEMTLNGELPSDFKERLDGYERFISQNLHTQAELDKAREETWKAAKKTKEEDGRNIYFYSTLESYLQSLQVKK